MSMPKPGDGNCWKLVGKLTGWGNQPTSEYLGKCLGYRVVGPPYDPDSEWTFEKKKVTGLGMQFEKTTCVPDVPANIGGRRKKTRGKSKKSRKTRRSTRGH